MKAKRHHSTLSLQSTDRVFSSTPATCQKLFTTISDDWSSIEVLSEEKFLRSMRCYPQKNALKPLVLLPPIKECCGALTDIRNRPAFPIVYTLNEKRIEDAWFLFALVSFYRNKGKLNDTDFTTEKMPSQRLDDDALCQKAWEEITSCTNPWIYHKCETVGCTEGKLINITSVMNL